jgi:hypothetical protein
VPLAAVRWVDGFKVGLEFIRTSPEEQHRLQRFVRSRMIRRRGSTWSEGIVVIGAMES